MIFLPEVRLNINDVLSDDEISFIEQDRNTERFIKSFPHDSRESRTRLLEVLTIVDPWFQPTDKDRVKLFSNILAPMVCNPQTSQRQHSLLSHLLFRHIFRSNSSVSVLEKHVIEFAKSMHIMLAEQKAETWFYLDRLGGFRDCLNTCRPMARVIDCILTTLQHFGSHVLLLETLESETNKTRLSITLNVLSRFTEHDSLTFWDESMHNRLRSRMSTMEDRTHISLVACVLANLDPRELAKFPLDDFIQKITQKFCCSSKEKYLDNEMVLRLLEKLSSSSEYQKYVISSEPLLSALLAAWQRDDSWYARKIMRKLHLVHLDMKHLWGIWANLADWVATTPHFFGFVEIAEEQLQKYNQNYHDEEFNHSYLKLSLKVRNCIMDPANIRYIHDSIRPRFQDSRRVEDTRRELCDRKLSPHQIESIRVFEWRGNIHSEDNRRLYAFKNANLRHVPVKLKASQSVAPWKFTTINNGLEVHLRGR